MRLGAQSIKFENGRIYLPKHAPWLDEYVSEITSFPGGKHDDQVDSTSQALAWIRSSACSDPWLRSAREEMGKMAGVGF